MSIRFNDYYDSFAILCSLEYFRLIAQSSAAVLEKLEY